MEKQILVVVKEPGMPPRVEPMFENTLEAFQKAVGGYIETVTLATDLVIICNEEGRLQDLPFNCELCGIGFVGTIIAAGVKGEDFASLKASCVPFVLKFFGGKENENH